MEDPLMWLHEKFCFSVGSNKGYKCPLLNTLAVSRCPLGNIKCLLWMLAETVGGFDWLWITHELTQLYPHPKPHPQWKSVEPGQSSHITATEDKVVLTMAITKILVAINFSYIS